MQAPEQRQPRYSGKNPGERLFGEFRDISGDSGTFLDKTGQGWKKGDLPGKSGTEVEIRGHFCEFRDFPGKKGTDLEIPGRASSMTRLLERPETLATLARPADLAI